MAEPSTSEGGDHHHALNANAKAFVPSHPIPIPAPGGDAVVPAANSPAPHFPKAKPKKHHSHNHGHGHGSPKHTQEGAPEAGKKGDTHTHDKKDAHGHEKKQGQATAKPKAAGEKKEGDTHGAVARSPPQGSVGSSDAEEHKRGRQKRRGHKAKGGDHGDHPEAAKARRARSVSPSHASLEKAFGRCRKQLIEEDAVDAIREALRSGAIPDVNELGFLHNSSSDGQTLLMVACKYGRHNTAKMLLEEFKADANVQGGLGHFSALHYAAWHQHPGITLMLLQHGADWSALNDDGETPAGAARGLCYQVITEWIAHPQCPIKPCHVPDHSRHPHPIPVVPVLPGQPIPLGAKPLFITPNPTAPVVPVGRQLRAPPAPGPRSRSLSPSHYKKSRQPKPRAAALPAPTAATVATDAA